MYNLTSGFEFLVSLQDQLSELYEGIQKIKLKLSDLPIKKAIFESPPFSKESRVAALKNLIGCID